MAVSVLDVNHLMLVIFGREVRQVAHWQLADPFSEMTRQVHLDKVEVRLICMMLLNFLLDHLPVLLNPTSLCCVRQTVPIAGLLMLGSQLFGQLVPQDRS